MSDETQTELRSALSEALEFIKNPHYGISPDDVTLLGVLRDALGE